MFFFGSRVTGKGVDERSDIDVGFSGLKELQGKEISGIKEAIENLPTLYKIDFVDFSKVSENFKSVALKQIELID